MKPPENVVRDMTEEDIDEVVEIDLYNQLPKASVKRYTKYIRCRDKFWASVLSDGNVINAYCIYRIKSPQIYIYRMAAHPDFGEIIALSYFLGIVKKAADESVDTRVVIHANERDLELQLFLKEQKFLATALLRGASEDGEDVYQFEYGVDLLCEFAVGNHK